MDVAVAERQLAMAQSMFQQGHFPEAVNYASKAMDLAEDLEADRDRCPKCHAETRPRWLLCPKCGQPCAEPPPFRPPAGGSSRKCHRDGGV